MKIVYGATDFVETNNTYPLANEIAAGLVGGVKWPKWKKLGEATSDEAVAAAQKAANEGQPAVAVWVDGTTAATGHVALVIPGSLVMTGAQTEATWKKRQAPCVANWKMASERGSFISKGMNYAFADPKGVMLFARSDVQTVTPPARSCEEIAKK